MPTLGWAIAAVATFFLVPVLGDAHFGIAQRIFIGTWLTWMLAATAYARAVNAERVAPQLAVSRAT